MISTVTDRGQGRLHVLQPLLEDPGRLQGVARLRAQELHLQGRPIAHADADLAVTRPALDVGDLSQPQQAQLGVRAQGEVLEGDDLATLVQAAQLAGGVGAPRAACRNIAAETLDPQCDVAQCQVAVVQVEHRHLDRHFVLGQAGELDPGDTAVQQVTLELTAQPAQIVDVVKAGDQEPRHGLVAHDAGHDRRFRLLGQVALLVHSILHLLQRQRHVGAGLELQGDRGHTQCRGRGHVADAVDGAQVLFQGIGDAALHVLGAGPGPDHTNLDNLELEVGKELGVQLEQGEGAAQDHQRDEQIRRETVMQEQPDQAAPAVARPFCRTGIHRCVVCRHGPVTGPARAGPW
jgi:hypothetical protein